MKEMVWDEFWEAQGKSAVDEIIESDGYYRLLKRLIVLPFSGEQTVRVLEVGCGSGIRTLALLKEFQGHPLEATLIDKSSSALSLAERNAVENKIKANLLSADGLNLPFSGETFDIVWSGGVNEHFEGAERMALFIEMARVVKRGGQLIIIVPNALNLPYRVAKKALELRGRWLYGFEKPFTIFELRNKMRRAGVVPRKAGGMWVVNSLFILLDLLGKRRATGSKRAAVSPRKNLSIWRRFSRGCEMILEETVGIFAGHFIGMRGEKSDISNCRSS